MGGWVIHVYVCWSFFDLSISLFPSFSFFAPLQTTDLHAAWGEFATAGLCLGTSLRERKGRRGVGEFEGQRLDKLLSCQFSSFFSPYFPLPPFFRPLPFYRPPASSAVSLTK